MVIPTGTGGACPRASAWRLEGVSQPGLLPICALVTEAISDQPNKKSEDFNVQTWRVVRVILVQGMTVANPMNRHH